VKPGRYLVDANGKPVYRADMPIQREALKMDNGKDAPKGISAPQPQLFSGIIEGILGGTLEWGLVVIDVLIAMSLELAGVRSLPFAVGMYIPLSSTTPIFIGGILRWISDRVQGKTASESETETSPGVLLSSGYIAGGTLCGLILAFFAFLPDWFNEGLDVGRHIGKEFADSDWGKLISLAMFGILCGVLLWVGVRKAPPQNSASS